MLLVYEISQKKKRKHQESSNCVLRGRYFCHEKNPHFSRRLVPPPLGATLPPPSTTMTSNRDKHCLIEDGWMEATRSTLELTLDARSFCLRVHVGMSAPTHRGTCYFVCTMSRTAQWALSLCFDTTWFMQVIDLHRLHLSKVEWFLIFLFPTLSCAKVQPILGTLTFPCAP